MKTCAFKPVLFSLALGLGMPAPAELTLRYEQPAEQWSAEALPLGNGQLGCMVFGGVERERIQFNEDSLWTGDQNPSGDYNSMGAYQSFGDLFITLSGDQPTPSGPSTQQRHLESGYSRTLRLDTATAEVTFQAGGAVHRREFFASHPDQVIACRWTADHPGALSARLSLRGTHHERTKAGKEVLMFSGTLPNGLDYEAQVRVLAKGGTITAEDSALALRGCDEVIVLLAAGTSYRMDYKRQWRGPHPHARLLQALDAAAGRPWKELRARHIADFQALFNRVSVSWGATAPAIRALPTNRRLAAYQQGGVDPELEALLFQYGRYLLISCSRRPGLPANLQGLWNDNNRPAWSCDYHSNINLQMNYWLAEPANLSECQLPFLDLVEAMLEPSRQATRAAFGHVRGWTARTSHNIFGGLGWEWNIPSSAWYAQHFWEHFAFTQDTNYLSQVGYPMLKEVCQFWQDHLKTLTNGTLVAPMGWSPEHGPREDGVAHDQQIVWDLFSNYLQAGAALGVDAAFRQQIADLRSRLAGPRVGHWGQLQEWMTDRDDPNDRHRHTSHLFAVYPGHQISLAQTPELARAAAVSLAARGETGDSRRSWTWPWRCALWARLGQSENAYGMVRGLLTYNLLPNLLATHPPFQIDGNFGITAGMCEMLLQSQTDELDLLPALPKAWPNGQVWGLRARGAITVDLTWDQGRLCGARLTPDHATTARVRYGAKMLERRLNDGVTQTLSAADFSGP